MIKDGYYVCDIETERLDNPEIVWCVVAHPISAENTSQKFSDPLVFYPYRDPKPLIEWWNTVKGVVGHNWIGFDGPILDRLYNLCNKPVIDTLVLSRLVDYNKQGGHSLDAWGERLGIPKLSFSDFENFSEEMVTYCIRDVEVQHRLTKHFLPLLTNPEWHDSISLEHSIATLCETMGTTGFAFDKDKAEDLVSTLSSTLQVLDEELQKAFPPRYLKVREVKPRVTKSGFLHKQDFRWWKSDDLSSFRPHCPFTIVSTKAFNPASPKDIVTRLNALGWRPTDRTQGHLLHLREKPRYYPGSGTPYDVYVQALQEWNTKYDKYKEFGWRVSEENLSTLPEGAPPAAHKLAQRIMVASRLSDLEEWLALYNEDTGRIHGRFIHIGAWTGRMAHRRPNMANIPGAIHVTEETCTLDKMKAPLNKALRALWGVPETGLLVGTDADSIQLRMFAHYCQDEEFIQSLLVGNKKDGTDPHSVNQRALGEICTTRDLAKTFLYSFLMGAGVAKLAEVLNCSERQATTARDNFLARYPRYAYLRNQYSEEVWAQGYFIGLDGRRVIPPSQHKLMSGLLQNGEAVLMKRANVIWQKRLQEESVPFRQVNFVHDEWQTETVRDQNIARYIGEVQCDSIRQAGVELDLVCPMAGNYQIGRNWYETH